MKHLSLTRNYLSLHIQHLNKSASRMYLLKRPHYFSLAQTPVQKRVRSSNNELYLTIIKFALQEHHNCATSETFVVVHLLGGNIYIYILLFC